MRWSTAMTGPRRGWSDPCRLMLLPLLACSLLASGAAAFAVNITDENGLREECSGMWAGKDTSIDMTFEPGATGTIATIFFEWRDFELLGADTPSTNRLGYKLRSYICTTQAVGEKLCSANEVGSFISSPNATTVQKQTFQFPRDGPLPKKITYPVKEQGYYCVGATAVPMTSEGDLHASFKAQIRYNNKFSGSLPAAEWPKLQFYLALTAAYVLLGAAWGFLCWKHRQELLTVQHFISITIGVLIVEMFVQWGYQKYLNSHEIDYWTMASLDKTAGVTGTVRFLLILTSILDAARNSLSFFLLLIVSMGYGVVRPSIGPVMMRVRILTLIHFVFGVLYSVGIVLLLIEQGGTWVFFFIFPLAFTLTSFMMWTLHSLNGTIEHLTARKQTYKRMMFQRLHRILMVAVVAIFAFFVFSTFAFSQSGSETFAPRSWPYRWFLLDGWLGSLYFVVFAAIAWLWRPTGQNLRLSMSDEIATEDDAEAGDFEIDTFAQRDSGEERDLEEARKKRALAQSEERQAAATAAGNGSAAGGAGASRGVSENDTMFSIGDGDDDDGPTPRTASMRPPPYQQGSGSVAERKGLMSQEDDEDDAKRN